MAIREDIKVGDKVIWYAGGWSKTRGIKTVARITKTLIVLSDGSKWNRRTGMGDRGMIESATDDQLAIFREGIRRSNLLAGLRKILDGIDDEAEGAISAEIYDDIERLSDKLVFHAKKQPAVKP